MERLRQERHNRSLTQKEVAEFIGISISMMRKIESGERKAGEATKTRLSKLYGKRIGYLFYNE